MYCDWLSQVIECAYFKGIISGIDIKLYVMHSTEFDLE